MCILGLTFRYHIGDAETNQDLNFQLFDIILLILAILVVGNFLRDGESNYLEGALCVLVYLIIAVTTFYYPNLQESSTGGETVGGEKAEHLIARGIARRLVQH